MAFRFCGRRGNYEADMTAVTRFLPPPDRSFFLLGPRGTGKSTWLRRLFPDALVVDLLDPERHRELSARPERLRQLVLGNADREVIVVDEVQKVPELLDVVHGLIEERPGTRFALTGSSGRKLRRAGVDLLGGRAAVRSMHPFLAAELGEEFDLPRALSIGLLPLVWTATDPDDVLGAYVGPYLREEVQAEGMVRNLGAFSRFLEAMSFAHGGVLNLSSVARDCGVRRSTAEGYFEVLEDLMLSFRVPAFTRRAKRHVTSKPKVYVFDVGVYRSLRPSGPLDPREEIEGAALEGLVAQHLRAWCETARGGHRLFYWRTKSGREVDFVVYGETGIFAFEVKRSGRVRSSDTRSLEAFRDDYPEARPRLLYLGEDRLLQNEVPCEPLVEFLGRLAPDRGLAST